MKKLDNKGMSLVEVVMAILIVSIASVLLVQSLSTVTRLISEADLRTRTTNDQLNALVGSKVNEGVEVTSTEKDVVINAEGLFRPITVIGNYEVATSSNESEVSIHNFTANENREDIYQKMLSNAKLIYKETKDMTADQKREYLARLEAKAGITTGAGMATGIRNDELRVFYYLLHGFPLVKKEIIAECNDIFDKGHPNASPTSNEGKQKIGDKDMYWKVYYPDKSEPPGNFILYAVGSDGINKEWATSLVYNEIDRSLYYKIFPVPEHSWQTTGSTIELSQYGSSTTGFLTLQADLQDETKWQKLKHK